ncbi:hypothetical protein ACMW09_003841 [Cronobacter malonaticus]|uniref:hypothetical protein n=1 Tax=Cronobacter malonaticus TaxID=413503 RepID=UPI0029CA5424|nr:hypothetical protein [Cronobacter malonaticus]ELZ9929168.1 hypothetical protein [Cronobacter malonaticus]
MPLPTVDITLYSGFYSPQWMFISSSLSIVDTLSMPAQDLLIILNDLAISA